MVQLKLGLRIPRPQRDPSKGRHIRTSKAAYAKGKDGYAAMRERIRVFIVGCDFHGTTSKEILRTFRQQDPELELHAISGRISELLADEEIFDSLRDRVDGCRVLVSRKEWINGTAEEGHKA